MLSSKPLVWSALRILVNISSRGRLPNFSSMGMACFAMYWFICHLNPWQRIDKQGVRDEHLDNRFFIIASNGEISIIDHSRLATVLVVWIVSLVGFQIKTRDVLFWSRPCLVSRVLIVEIYRQIDRQRKKGIWRDPTGKVSCNGPKA